MCALDVAAAIAAEEEDLEPTLPIITQIKQEPQDVVSPAVDIDSATFSFVVKEEPSSPASNNPSIESKNARIYHFLY